MTGCDTVAESVEVLMCWPRLSSVRHACGWSNGIGGAGGAFEVLGQPEHLLMNPMGQLWAALAAAICCLLVFWVRIQKNLLDGVSQLALAVLVTGASQSRQHEVEIGDLLHEGFGGLEVLALSHTDFSDLFSVLLDAVNFPHMAKILPVGIHLRQVLDDMCFLISRNWEFPMGFFYFLDVIQEATTLRLRWNPISIRIAPKMWSSSLSSVVYSVLKNLGAITLTVCTTFDSRVESACFELTGLDKAIHLIKLGENWRDFERGGEQNNVLV
ncbi:hypothetical protein Tco_0007135 [Tanacetum coccineum]